MNNKYYTSLEISNNKYIGKIFSTSNNELVYTSKEYPTQEQAMTDIRTYLATSAPPTNPIPVKTNTAVYQSPRPVQRGGCCGRR